MRLKKIFIILLLLITVEEKIMAQDQLGKEGSSKAEPSVKVEEKTKEAEFNVRNFRDPFLTWLPKAILEKIEESIGSIPRVSTQPREPQDRITEEEISPPAFKIQGLIWNTDFPQAIVNERIIKIGDIIDEAKILNITKEGITILYKNKEFLIKPES